jgi:hypothetical protein
LNRINSDKTFDKILNESIDSAFSILGEQSKNAIYNYLQKKFGINKQDIPQKLDDFSHALEEVFGLGARHLEILIMKKLHEKICSTYKWEGPSWLLPDLTFRKYVLLMELAYTGKTKTADVAIMVNEEEEQKNEYRK